MAAMRRSITEMYVPNPKRGACEPTIEMPDEGHLSALSSTMRRNVQTSMKKERKQINHIPKQYSGPHIAGFAMDKQHMPVITNSAHTAQTNNGYNRKPCGGFFFH